MIKKFTILILTLSGISTAFSQDTIISDSVNLHYQINIKSENNKVSNEIAKVKKKFIDNNIFKDWKIGLSYGVTQFDGDIRQYDHYPSYQKTNNFFELKSAISLSINKKLNSLFYVQAELIAGKFSGLRRETGGVTFPKFDPYGFYQNQGEFFITEFKEADINILTNISTALSYFSNKKISKNYILYAKTGVGFNIFNSVKRNLMSEDYIYSYGYEDEGENGGYIKKDIFSSPSETDYLFGLILERKLNKHIQFFSEITSRVTTSDKWDSSIEELNTTRKNDSYVFYCFGLTYLLGEEIDRKEWISPIDYLKEDMELVHADIDGLSDDSDQDGVADSFDKHPNTPIGVAVDGSGVPFDVDMDNVPDYIDSDPFSSRGAIVDLNGIEFDSDNDGIPDSKDLESNTSIGAIVNQYGITINNMNNTDGYLPSIYFATGSKFISSSNLKRLTTIAQIMINNPNIKMNIVGNTDFMGTDESNTKLGKQRADEVVLFLVQTFGIDKSRCFSYSNGEKNPVTINQNTSKELSNQSLLEINRRVDFEIIY